MDDEDEFVHLLQLMLAEQQGDGFEDERVPVLLVAFWNFKTFFATSLSYSLGPSPWSTHRHPPAGTLS